MSALAILMRGLPPVVKYAVAAVAAVALYFLGMLKGERAAGESHIAYVEQRAAQDLHVAVAREKVVVRTEVEYRDRIKTIYVKGEEIEKLVPVYITRDDDQRFGVNAGFVRSFNAAWSGEPPGPAAESDREPAGIPLSEVGEVEAHNATTCRAWREQALGWREFYGRLRSIESSAVQTSAQAAPQ